MIASAVVSVSAIRGSWEGITWELTDGTLTVSGSEIPDSTQSSFAPWRKFADSITSIALVGTKRIGNYSFAGLSRLRSLSLDGVTAIGEYAFSGCSSLETVNIPSGTAAIGSFAFAECTALTAVTLPETLTSLGIGVFESCSSLSEISCVGGKYQNSGISVIDTERASIVRCPPAATAAEFSVPSGITSIECGAFRDCTALTSVDLADVTVIGDGAFYNCTALESITADHVQTIGRAAFYTCTSVTNLTLPESLASIGDSAFADCASLARVALKGNAPECGSAIFDGASAAFTVIAYADATGFGTSDFWLGYPILRHGIYSGDVGALTWSLDTESGVLEISGVGDIPDFEEPADAPWYEYRRAVTSVDIGSGVTSVGKNAFRYASVIHVLLPESVLRIGEFALSGCTALTSVVAPGATDIGKCAFYNDTALIVCDIPAASIVGDQAFSGAEALRWVLTGVNAPSFGEWVFDDSSPELLYARGGVGYDSISPGITMREYCAGDADANGICGMSDAVALLKYLAKWDVSIDEYSADTDMNGKITVNDAINMLKYLAKWDIRLGVYRYMG